jgi:pyruvate kinase
MKMDDNNSKTEHRRTKIIATLGPATDKRETLRALILAGADVLRLNMSHGPIETHEQRMRLAREVAAETGREVAILFDLQGPKIRIETFREGSVLLESGERFELDAGNPSRLGDRNGVGVSYARLADDVKPDDVLLLDDGLLSMRVLYVTGRVITCEVENGGVLGNRKGINLQGGGLSIAGIAEHDLQHIKLAARLDADYVAVSFARNADDMNRARALLRQSGSQASLMAKIERIEAIDNLEEICDASDAILVARGDLGVEIGFAELPGLQKRIITTALQHNRIVATATQMMQSMVENPIPTRAEVLDVANAVLDGSDAVMLSAETAVGRHPVKVVETMHRICLGAERHFARSGFAALSNVPFERIDQAIAMAAMYTARNIPVQAIVALTESGSTAQWLSRVQSSVPIFALSPSVASRRRMALFRDVYPVAHEQFQPDIELAIQEVLQILWRKGHVRSGDRLIVTMGEKQGQQGGTNTLRLIQLGSQSFLKQGVDDSQAELDLP